MTDETFGQALRRSRLSRGLSLRNLQVLARYDFTYLGQVERGEKPGSFELAKTCDKALGLAGELVEIYRRSATRPASPPDGNDDMRRRTALKALAVTPLAVAAPAHGTAATDEATRLERTAEIYRSLYHNANSPRDLLALAHNHLDTTIDVLHRVGSGPDRTRVLRNRSEIGTLAGRLAFFDIRDPVTARGYFHLAHEAASQAADHALVTAALGHLAYIPAGDGNTSAALDYLHAAADNAERIGTSLLHSWIRAVEAELLSTVNRTASLHALDAAQRLLDQRGAEPSPPWFDYYSRARFSGFRGYTLMKAGRITDARAALAQAVDGLPATAVKQRAVFLTDIASAYVTGTDTDVEHACTLASASVSHLTHAGYATANVRLRAFRRQVRRWEDTQAVRDLDERLALLPN